jgi:hypothetical protein
MNRHILIALAAIAAQGAAAALAQQASPSCALEPVRFEGVEPPPATATLCNLPEAPLQRVRDGDAALSRLRGEVLAVAVERDGVPADGQSAVVVRVSARDRDGAALLRAAPVTVETSLGRIVNDDVVSSRNRARFLEDRDRRTPGVQGVLRDGVVEFTLLAPYEPGDALLRISSGDVQVEATVSFVPDMRPTLAVGILEGQVNLSRLSSDANTPTIRDDGLEATLSEIDARQSGDERTSLNGRAAFFYKGVVDEKTLVTAAYDSDKDRVGLFRDILPDQFYPIYGDSSLRGFEAQSTRRGYLRLDRGKSNLLFGDFTTGDSAGELRNLGLYSRSLTGGRWHYETGRAALNVWAARDSVRQVIDEQPGRGISGPYAVSNANGLANSEKVEIVIRDRAQPSIILSQQALARFTDYEFEPFTGRLIFRKPVPSLDANLNPVSIRITYEVDEGGPQFEVYGADGRLRLGESFELGAAYARTDDPTEPYDLGSVSASWRIGAGTVWVAEAARSGRDAALVQLASEGHAFRTELRHLGERLDARLFYGRSTDDFDNVAAALNGGRLEAGGKLTWRLTEATDVTAEALQSEDARVGASRRGALLMLGHRFNDVLRLEGGLRWFDDEATGAAAGQTTYSQIYNLMPPGSIGTGAFVNGAAPTSGQNTTARLRLSAAVNAKSLLYLEGEQGLDDSDAHAWAVGGEYQLLDRLRLYARHEDATSLSSLYGLNDGESRRATVFGVDSAYMNDGAVFSEYRLRSAIPGRESEAAVGLRNLWPLRPGLAFSTALERVQVLDGSRGDATAVAFGVESTRRENAKGSARFEWRGDEAADSWLSTLAYTRKLSRDWSLLGRNLFSHTENDDAQLGRQIRNRAIVGLAWRETDRNRWNALMRYENKLEREEGLADPFDRDVHIVSAHVNWHPNRPLTVAGQLAAKWVDEQFGSGPTPFNARFEAQLASARVLYDLTERWDLGLQASGLISRDTTQYGLGIETGYAVVDNLWLSVGFNFIGFDDDDLVESDYTRRGAYIRLRFKFDEKIFRGRDRNWNNSL